MIVRNKGTPPVVITSNWQADPHGGPAINRTDYMIGPDGAQGIDLDIVGLVSEEYEGLKAKLALAKGALEDVLEHRCEGCYDPGLIEPVREALEKLK